MTLFSRKKEPEVKQEMRMRFSAPSFLFYKGDVISPWTLKDLKESSESIRGRIVILHPGINCLLRTREWMKVLSSGWYLIICGEPDDEYIKVLEKEAGRVVCGLVPKTLSGVSVCRTEAEAEEVYQSLLGASPKGVVTVNNTEGETGC